MKDLHDAIKRLIRDIEAVQLEIEVLGSPLRAHHRQTIELQLNSLRVVDRELRQEVVSRRVWSLGEATVPVVRAMLKAAGKPKIGLTEGVVQQAQRSTNLLRQELHRFAEGR